MSDSTILAAARQPWSLSGWATSALFLVASAVIGPEIGAPFRMLFVLGCAAVGWHAWRCSPSAHLQAALLLFAFAPIVRRLVDLSAGYDTTGIMLVGPLLAIMAPVSRLKALLDGERPIRHQTIPILIIGLCVSYAAALSMFQGDWMNAASGSLKWFAPLIYAAVLCEFAETDELLQGATSAFLVILPITGLIGIWQYIDPPAWDRYWMQFAPIMSVGQPLPYEVRVFSTMNGPASFATFTAAGLLLVSFLRSDWRSLVLAIPAALALLLSLYRTAWLSLMVGMLFCILYSPTRRRAGTILIAILVGAAVAATWGPFAETIGERLGTLGDGGQDGSAQERLDQFAMVWSLWDSSLFGSGFTTTDVGSAGAMAIDGLIIYCWISMGIVVGLFCLSALVWAAGNTIAAAWRHQTRNAVVIGALGCGALIQLPLANIASGELGFLFWTFAALAPFHGNKAFASGTE